MRKVLFTALIALSCAAPGTTTRSESPDASTTVPPRESGGPSSQPTTGTAGIADAGVLFFFSGSKAGWSRLDAASGRLTDIGYASVSVQAETSQGSFGFDCLSKRQPYFYFLRWRKLGAGRVW